MRKCTAPSPFCECLKCFHAKHSAKAVVSSAIVRRWDGPNHTADQQCAVCRCWGAENYVNKGNAGITQMLWLCDVCNTPNEKSDSR